VGAIKSRVNGSENLTVIMHQHQLLNFASKFGLIPLRDPPQADSFTAEGYDNESANYSFLSKKGHRSLTPTQVTQLQRHYKTIFAEEGLFDDRLFENMDKDIEIWHRCRAGDEVFYCKEYERQNSRRLNYLAAITQWVDSNAHVSYKKRQEHMVERKDYVYIQFFGVHRFRGQAQMVMYSEYRRYEEHDGLVEDKGSRYSEFQDIQALDHLCAQVSGAGNKIYFIDDRVTMEQRLRDALAATKK
jgi:hypothetical protein